MILLTSWTSRYVASIILLEAQLRGVDNAKGVVMRSGEDRAHVAAREGRKPGQAMVLLPPKQGEAKDDPAAYIAGSRQALIDDNPVM